MFSFYAFKSKAGGGPPSRGGVKAFFPLHIVRRRALHPEYSMDSHSDSEEELAAFCPQVSWVWALHH